MFTYEEANQKKKEDSTQHKKISENKKSVQKKKQEKAKKREDIDLKDNQNKVRIHYSTDDLIQLKPLSYEQRKKAKNTYSSGQVIQCLEYDEENCSKSLLTMPLKQSYIEKGIKNSGKGYKKDETQWMDLKGEAREFFKLFCDTNGKNYLQSQNGVVPVQFVKEQINKIMTDKNIYDLYQYIKTLGVIPNHLVPLFHIFEIKTVVKAGIEYTSIHFGAQSLTIRRDQLEYFELNEFKENLKSFIRSYISVYS